MALLERDIMIGASFTESVTQDPPSKGYLADREREFNETSLPGEIFNVQTGEIIRNPGHKTSHTSSFPTVTDINDYTVGLIEKEMAQEAVNIQEPTIRRRLSMRRVVASLTTSFTG